MVSKLETCFGVIETQISGQVVWSCCHVEQHVGIKELKEHDNSREW